MRKSENKKRFKLSRETLRRLVETELKDVNGGYTTTFPPTVSSRVQQC